MSNVHIEPKFRSQERNRLLNEIRTAEKEVDRLETSLSTLSSSDSIQDGKFKANQLRLNRTHIEAHRQTIQEHKERIRLVGEGSLDQELEDQALEIAEKTKAANLFKLKKETEKVEKKKEKDQSLQKFFELERATNYSDRCSERDMKFAYLHWSKIKFPDLSDWPRNRGKIVHPRYQNNRFDFTTWCYGTRPPIIGEDGSEYPYIMFEQPERGGPEIKHVIYPDYIEYYEKVGNNHWELIHSSVRNVKI